MTNDPETGLAHESEREMESAENSKVGDVCCLNGWNHVEVTATFLNVKSMSSFEDETAFFLSDELCALSLSFDDEVKKLRLSVTVHDELVVERILCPFHDLSPYSADARKMAKVTVTFGVYEDADSDWIIGAAWI
jgi:hypothetical protein